MAAWVEVEDSRVSSRVFVNLDHVLRLELSPGSTHEEGTVYRVYIWANPMALDGPGIQLRLDESSSWNNEADVKRLLNKLGVHE